jgi:sulfatase modifying factor 1
MNGKSCCAPTRGAAPGAVPAAPEPPPAGAPRFTDILVPLPGGQFLMGTDDADGWPQDGEGPVREVSLSPFAIDATAVTNGQFTEFVATTGYRTDAEKFGWSYVFIQQLPKAWRRRGNFYGRAAEVEWWIGIKGASWNAPEGPGSRLKGRESHPVVHVSWADAAAFARWAGKRLPSEAEWEYAARGGLVQKRYPWGDELVPDGKHRCNIWQGKFPEINRPEDGYLWTAPVRAFPPNGYGLYETSGNVWEWCADYWETQWTVPVPPDPRGPAMGSERVIRGGSFLCHKSYCNRYRVGARSKNAPDSTTSHTGFRCAVG